MSKLHTCADLMNLVHKMSDEADQLESTSPGLSKKLSETAEAVSKEIMEELVDSDAFFNAARLLADSLRSGNKILNIDDCYFNSTFEALVEVFREYGIEDFTVSVADSSTMKMCSGFIAAGCSVYGMREVYLNSRDYGEVANKRGMAFEFSVD